jgi:predicted dehydrogenase
LTSSLNGENVKQRIETQPGDYRKFYENLYLAIRHGEELAVKPEEALMVVEMLNTCLESHRQGRTIFLG